MRYPVAATRAFALKLAPEQAADTHSGRAQLNLVRTDPLELAYRRQLPVPETCCPVLSAAVRHALLTPGSLMRMRVAFPLAQAFGLTEDVALQAATAIEYFHTASLLLDDLPCMDDASDRRGEPCVHRVYGQDEAILAALAFINRAYALAWKAMLQAGQRTAAADHAAAGYLEQLLGLAGVLSGQSRDLHAGAQQGADRATLVARQKTVSLIRLAVVWPAQLGGASHRILRLLERIAHGWGLAYQALDDLKDVLLTATDSGKTAARDALLQRPNLAIELGIRAAFDRIARLLQYGDRVFAAACRQTPQLAALQLMRAGIQHEFDVLIVRHTAAVDVWTAQEPHA